MQESLHKSELDLKSKYLDFEKEIFDFKKERMLVMERFRSEIVKVKVKISSATI